MTLLKTTTATMVFLCFSLSYSQPDSAAQKANDTVGNTAAASASFEQRAKTAQTLFTAGSIMAITGLFAIAVSGNTDLAATLGTTLLVIGHGGLIMTGIGNNMMKQTVLKKYPDKSFDFAPTSGWVVYGSGLGVETAGVICFILAIKSDNDFLGWGGVIGVVAGELITKLSWFSFNNNMNYWRNMFQNVSLSPQFRIERNGQNSYGSALSFKF